MLQLKKKIKDVDNLAGYLFIMPWLIGFIAFTLYPVICSLYYSFTQYNMIAASKWVGLKNYKNMFLNDEKFWISMKVTFIFVFTSVPTRLAVALFIAIMLNKKYKSIGFFRTAFYIPSIIGGSIAVAVMWRQIFGNSGVIMSLLDAFGYKQEYSLLGNPNTSLLCLVLLAVWQYGSSMIIFLAGLKNIPETYYEAAVIDGANSRHKFFKITLPMLTPVILFNLVMQLINGFMVFSQSFVITKGGPMDSTLMYALYIYRRSFEFMEMGYASSLAWIMLIIIAGFTAILFKTSSSWVYYEAKGGV